MMASVKTCGIVALATLATLLVNACASPPEYFYTLEPVATTPINAAPYGSFNIAIGPVTLPEVIDRPQLVLHASASQVELPDNRRWAESLRSAIPRVIAANLSRQLPGAVISTHTDGATAPANYRVAIDILRFDARPGNDITLEVHWRIQPNGRTPQIGTTMLREALQGGGYAEIVAAHNRALGVLSQEIAAAIKVLGGT